MKIIIAFIWFAASTMDYHTEAMVPLAKPETFELSERSGLDVNLGPQPRDLPRDWTLRSLARSRLLPWLRRVFLLVQKRSRIIWDEGKKR